MGEALHRRRRPIVISPDQMFIPDYLVGADIRFQEHREPPGLPYPKLSFTRMEHLARLIAHPELRYEDIVANDPELNLPNLVDIQKGQAIHTIQLLGQVWRWCLPYHEEGSRRDYPKLYEQKLYTIATALPTVSSADIHRFITLLSDERLGTDPSTHDVQNRIRRLRAYEIIASRVLKDMFTRSPFTDMPSLPYERETLGEWPNVDPSAFCNLWNDRKASEAVMQQTNAIFDYHESLPFMPGVDGRGMSGLEVRHSLLLHNVGVLITEHTDQVHRDVRGLHLVDFKSGRLHIPMFGIQSETLQAALTLTGCAARTFTRADLRMQGRSIELTNFDLVPPEEEQVHIRYVSFASGTRHEHDFSPWQKYLNTTWGVGRALTCIEKLLDEVARDPERLGPVVQ